MNTYLHITLACLGAASLAGCATTANIGELNDARTEVQQVESNPLAGEYAAQEVERAHNRLREAERLAEKGGSAEEVRQNAYLAKRHAQIATQQIAVAQAREEIRKAESERERVVAEARANEARAAAGQATAARQQAELTAEEAQRRAQMLQDELEQLKAKKTDRGFVLTLGDVLFDTGKATLKPGAHTTIERLSKFLQESPERTVIIEGHTDSVGTSEYNQELSQRRADAVKNALLERGVSADRIQSVGKGEDYPVASNDNAAGRQQNRRVEVVISETAEDRSAQSSSSAGGPARLVAG